MKKSLNICDNKGKVNIIVLFIIVVIVLAISSMGIFAFVAMYFIGNEIDNNMSKDSAEYDTSVTAVITENKNVGTSVGEGVDTRSSDSYMPVYRYEYNGKVYSVFGSAATSEPRYNVGDEVVVYISSDDPFLF